MEFAHGSTVKRLRARPLLDPYSKKAIGADWATADEVELPGAFVASSSSAVRTDATRTQALEWKSLYLTDVAADVQVGDRIVAAGVTYVIDAVPTADVNPFTGWQPVREIPLKSGTG